MPMATKQAGPPGRLRVTLVKSPIGFNARQGTVVQGLGLRRIGHSVEVADVPSMRGMIQKVRHLVRVEPAGA
jgi:large subunit ribosomal protein L30